MSPSFTYLASLEQEAKPPDDGILSRTLYNDEQVKAVLFGFGAGQELSEHTATMPAILQFLSGEASLTLGEETREAKAGTFVHMPAGLRHAIRARIPTVMLLLLLKTDRSGEG
jgi:quercetin dioxygenase-like cupin family protein